MLQAETHPLTTGQVTRIRRKLLHWGRANYRDFPWRPEPDPWLALVAEFFLQRTRAAQVARFYQTFCARYPTTRALLEDRENAVAWVTERLGLHWRGPLLLELAEAVEANGGTPPESESALRAIRGVGPYTAAAWLSIHRNVRALIIDSNIARLYARLTGMPYRKDPRGVRWLQRLADDLTPRRAFRDFNLALLDFTMTRCIARAPYCGDCPLRRDCAHGRIDPPPRNSTHSARG